MTTGFANWSSIHMASIYCQPRTTRRCVFGISRTVAATKPWRLIRTLSPRLVSSLSLDTSNRRSSQLAEVLFASKRKGIWRFHYLMFQGYYLHFRLHCRSSQNRALCHHRKRRSDHSDLGVSLIKSVHQFAYSCVSTF